MRWSVTGAMVGLFAASLNAGASFVNWESPHVHPLDITSDGLTLVAANTPDNRIEVYDIGADGGLSHRGSVPVGLDPVSVRALNDAQVWVVNRISDSVTIVDIATLRVMSTIRVADEPSDVVFAQNQAFISMGTANEIGVYDLPYAAGAQPAAVIPIAGEEPRALATDGQTVYAAIFFAGNGTTVLNHSLVTNAGVNPYPGDPNPPPNAGNEFQPPINPALLADNDGNGQPDIRLPKSSLILQLDESGAWMDDNGHDWSDGLSWTLNLHGMAKIDASSHAVSYVKRLNAINTALDVNPVSGEVAVVGTELHNIVRFEPNQRGTFVSVSEFLVEPPGDVVTHVELNPHISEFMEDPDGGFPQLGDFDSIPPSVREQSIGDPAGVAWDTAGASRFVTGRGSNSVIQVGGGGARLGQVEVGEGPTGIVMHPTMPLAYVLNKFSGSISVIDTALLTETAEISFYDPTPPAIRLGRPHFYNTQVNSGLGQASCQSCHVNGASDLLAWDLGDPSGEMKQFNQICNGGTDICDQADWHPMKGPMTTQSMFGLAGTEPFHWRGDRENLAAFNPAFVSILAGNELTPQQLAQFEAFVATLTYPPNPYRNLDGSLRPSLFNGGNPQNGKFLFETPPAGNVMVFDPGVGHVMMFKLPGPGSGQGQPEETSGSGGFDCIRCHALPDGTNSQIVGPMIEDTTFGLHHLIKVAQLRDIYRKDGFNAASTEPINRGTGYLHDGSFDTVQEFLKVFFSMSTQNRKDLEAFLFSFGTDTHAGVGAQVTLSGAPSDDLALRNQLVAIAESGDVALVVKGTVGGIERGYFYLGDQMYQSDHAGEQVSQAQLDGALAVDQTQTYTLVPSGTEVRVGVDRDEDGALDADEVDGCSDPADPDSFPGSETCPWDVTDAMGQLPDAAVDVFDLLSILEQWDAEDVPQDVNCSHLVDVFDILEMIDHWGACP